MAARVERKRARQGANTAPVCTLFIVAIPTYLRDEHDLETHAFKDRDGALQARCGSLL
jgi:hypothetical protein